jgi:hypothetical protein
MLLLNAIELIYEPHIKHVRRPRASLIADLVRHFLRIMRSLISYGMLFAWMVLCMLKEGPD